MKHEKTLSGVLDEGPLAGGLVRCTQNRNQCWTSSTLDHSFMILGGSAGDSVRVNKEDNDAWTGQLNTSKSV